MIDLRSDTVTRPDKGMRAAMASAEVGDDVFGEDPTVIRLQEVVAERLGKEAALFVPSGSMGNQIAVHVHTQPGQEVILDAGCHIANYESASAAAWSGVQLRQIPSGKGHPDVEAVESSIRAGYYWEPEPALVCLENTHNKAGGTVFPLDDLIAVADLARSRNLALHLDGARLWNASVASGVTEAAYAAPFDSVMVCLSKGLGAPVGSLVAGSTEFIRNAHRVRKMFGGGMRQVGVLAAAGLYALENNYDRLERDHAHAQLLASAIDASGTFVLTPNGVETNIVMFDVADGRSALEIVDELRQIGVLVVPFGPKTLRATTHLDITDGQIQEVARLIQERY